MAGAISTTCVAGVLTISIDRAPVNALGPEDWSSLQDAVAMVATATSIRAVVLSGGQGGFCAGADIRVLTEPTDDPAMMLTIVDEACEAIRTCRVPVIAAIDGAAHGGGLELALACDIRVASNKATFAASGVNMGLVASVWSLVHAIGDGRARLMLLTGERFDAATAESWGLISLLADAPTDRAKELAEHISTKAPLAIEANKAALRSSPSEGQHEHGKRMTALFAELASTADHREAVAAFLEKRSPTFDRT
ncbi:MAG: enoyl-CoA hydratase [Verrucomicrobiales bacterium]|jgi:enoyl-CoA hydratase